MLLNLHFNLRFNLRFPFQVYLWYVFVGQLLQTTRKVTTYFLSLLDNVRCWINSRLRLEVLCDFRISRRVDDQVVNLGPHNAMCLRNVAHESARNVQACVRARVNVRTAWRCGAHWNASLDKSADNRIKAIINSGEISCRVDRGFRYDCAMRWFNS